VHGTLLKLAGLALDARAITARDFVERAQTARWIAANALATRGIQLAIEGVAPRGARVFGLRATTFAAAIAAIAAVPVLIDAATLPAHWRYLLRALGMPVLTESPAAAIEAGASVLGCDPGAACELAVDQGWQGYRVRIAAPQRMLVA
jgi:hypothetical protein